MAELIIIEPSKPVIPDIKDMMSEHQMSVDKINKIINSDFYNQLTKLSNEYSKNTLTDKLIERDSGMNTFQKAIYLIINFPKIIDILFLFISLIKGFSMNNDKKTSMIGLVKIIFGVLTLILGYFKISVPDGLLDATIDTVMFFTTGAGYLLFSFIQAFFTNKKDK